MSLNVVLEENPSKLSKIELHSLFVMFELISLMFTIMVISFSNRIREFTQEPTISYVYALIPLGILIIHGVYLSFLVLVLKDREQIQELSQRRYNCVVYISPSKKLTIIGTGDRNMKPQKVVLTEDNVKKVLESKVLQTSLQKIRDDQVPILDINRSIFDPDQVRDLLLPLPTPTASKIEDTTVSFSVGEVLEKFRALKETIFPEELSLYLYILNKELQLDQSLYFSSKEEEPDTDLETSELFKILGKNAPRAFFLLRPEYEEIEEESLAYNLTLQDFIKTYTTHYTLFYIGAVGGIPIFVDICNLGQISKLYKLQTSLSSLHEARLTGLIYLIVSLTERWDRRGDSEKRNELYAKLSLYRNELATKEMEILLEKMGKEVKDIKTRTQITLDLKTINITTVVVAAISFILGLLIRGVFIL